MCVGGCASLRVTASITFSQAQLILAAITLWNENYVPTAWQTVLCYWACLLVALAVNVFFNRCVVGSLSSDGLHLHLKRERQLINMLAFILQIP